jgi:benzoylformate decarboxylase
VAEALRTELGAAGHPEAAARRAAQGATQAAQRAELSARAQTEAGRVPISALAAVRALAETVADDAVVVDESISSSAGVRDFFRCRDPKSFFSLRGGGIGWGLPAALGVKLALPSRPVLALVGDGSAMYTIQALWTAAHEGLAVVAVIFNNHSYRILKQRTLLLKGFSAEDDHYVAMDLDRPFIDFVGLARSLGVPGERVDKTSDVAPALGRGLASGGPYLLDLRIDPAFEQ